MREKRTKLWATMEGFLDTHRNDMGVLSTEDDAVYANMEKEFEALSNEIRRQERRDAHEAELSKPINRPITEKPAAAPKADGVGRASNAYKEDFGLHLRGKALVHNVLSTTPDEDGGFLVPLEFERDIVKALDEENIIRWQRWSLPTTSVRFRLPWVIPWRSGQLRTPLIPRAILPSVRSRLMLTS